MCNGECNFPYSLALVSLCTLTTLSSSLPAPSSLLYSAQSFQGSATQADHRLSGLIVCQSLFQVSLAYSLPSFWNYPPSLLWQKKKTSFSRNPIYLTLVELTTSCHYVNYIEIYWIYIYLHPSSPTACEFPNIRNPFKVVFESQNS